jgi:hypothetical protein
MKELLSILLRESLLSEVGEGIGKVYDYEAHGNETMTDYYFTTDGGLDYIVYIKDSALDSISDDHVYSHLKEKDVKDVSFKVEGGTYTDVVNKGEFFSVMATVIACVKDFISKYSPEVLLIEPAKRTKDDTRRLNIYHQYIKKQFPYYTVEIVDEDIIVFID